MGAEDVQEFREVEDAVCVHPVCVRKGEKWFCVLLLAEKEEKKGDENKGDLFVA